MAINVARYEHHGQTLWGVVRGQRITPVAGSDQLTTTGEFIEKVAVSDLKSLLGNEIALADVRVLSPITRNQQFVCQGANYRQHMIESGMNPDAKNFNMIFTKATSCIVPADSELIKPQLVKYLDYEVELGLVMRRSITGKISIQEGDLHQYIAGLVVVNDYSARDVQIPQMQFYKGKSFRTFGPVGPWLCLLEQGDFHYLKKLQLRLTVDGQVRQNDNTANMVYPPVETLNELSTVQDLHVGDLIATGTPAGCALAIPSPTKQKFGALLPDAKKWALFLKAQASRTQYLRAGQIVETSIRSDDGVIDLGVQRNCVVDGK
jgi:2,4-didehydro-3-deoxy-L-rhamnonate hydrolase